MGGYGDILKEIAARVEKNQDFSEALAEGDYIKDGLLYCHKCNTPRQCVIDIGDGETLKPPCLCQCRTEARDNAIAEEKARKEAERLEIRRRKYIRVEKLLSFTFEQDKQPESKYTEIFKRYVKKWEQIKAENIGLVLWGETSRGKSFYAGCICNALIDMGVVAYAETEPNIIDKLFDAPDKSKYIHRLANYPLLLIDDFGTVRNTEYAQEQIFKIIDERYKANLPTIITTNFSPARFDKPESLTEQRIFERIKAMGQFIEIKGKNWRQEEAQEKAAAFLNIMSGGE